MKLWIGRHAYAGPPSTDPRRERERPLNAEGVATAKAIAKALVAAGEVPNVIFSSPFSRAIQTADIYGKAWKVQVNVIGDLAPNRPLERGIADLIGYDDLKRVMIVGHKDNTTPLMQSFGGDWDDLAMAEVRRVEIDRGDCSWSLEFALRPSDIGRKDRAS